MIHAFAPAVGKEEVSELEACVRSGWLGMGEKVRKFEALFKEFQGLPNFVMLDSGSNALYMAVRLLDLPEGMDIIVPSFTWVACAHAITLNGYRPVFCDVELETQNVSAETIKPHISSNTGAIMVVHYAGKPVDMDPILDLGFPVIEDAAHAVTSMYKDRPCGGIGDIGIYSFDAVKNLTTGAGGGITCRDPTRSDSARRLRYCGIGRAGYEHLQANSSAARWWEHDFVEPFIKTAPTDLNASIGLAQIKKIGKHQKRRAEIWKQYQRSFADLDGFETPEEPSPDSCHSYFTYFIRTDTRHRDSLARYLWERGIYSTLRFHPLHLQRSLGSTAVLPNSEHLSESGLNIPLHPALSDEDVDRVVCTIRLFYKVNT